LRDTPRPITAGGLGALGIGNAYVWRSAELAEITYNDAEATAEQVAQKGNALLPALATALGEKLPGSSELPASVKLLPTDDRLPMGIRYEMSEALGKAASPGAIGYYQQGDKRWRVVVFAARDEAHAAKLLREVSTNAVDKEPLAPAQKLGRGSARLVVGATKSEWLAGENGVSVVGVGDEPLVLREGMSEVERERLCLSRDQKQEKLTQLLARGAK
jgi:hypothetical protein